MYTIVEKNIGRAGTKKQLAEKQKVWDSKYGKDNWITGYELNSAFLTREDAIQQVYFKSYFALLDSNPALLKTILTYGGVFNPHAHFTNSVDLQAEAIETYLTSKNLSFQGPANKFLAAGVWQPKFNQANFFEQAKAFGIRNDGTKFLYPKESYTLSPFKVMCWQDKTLSVEHFWQSPAKCLAIKN